MDEYPRKHRVAYLAAVAGRIIQCDAGNVQLGPAVLLQWNAVAQPLVVEGRMPLSSSIEREGASFHHRRRLRMQ